MGAEEVLKMELWKKGNKSDGGYFRPSLIDTLDVRST